jgi:antitoxin (DNA-binding transcriptional repressor) of toxin-antitoxin stability system
MSTVRKREELVGVRELRQNLSVYLARLATGTVFRVTDRGRAVAMLIPLPAHNTTVERLVAAGRAKPATRDLLALGRPPGRMTTSLSKALQEVREDIV